MQSQSSIVSNKFSSKKQLAVSVHRAKKLNGASSRMMVYFAMTVSADIFNAHPTNINRLGGLKIPTKLMSFWFSKKPLDFRPWMPAGGSGMRLHRLEPWRWLLRNMGRARCQHLWTNGLRKNICDTGILTTVPHQHYIEIFDDTPQHRSIWIGTVFFAISFLRFGLVGFGSPQTSIPSTS